MGRTHDQLVEAAKLEENGDSNSIMSYLEWWKNNVRAGTKTGAALWAKMSSNVSSTYESKIQSYGPKGKR